MIESAAAPNGVFFDDAQAGEGFTRVVNLRAGPFDTTDKAVGQRSDAGHVLKKIQDYPLRRQQRAHWPADAEQRRAARVAETSLDDLHVESRNLLDAQALVISAADHLDDGQAAGDSNAALNERADADLFFGDQQPAGDVAGEGSAVRRAKVFMPRGLDQVLEFIQ